MHRDQPDGGFDRKIMEAVSRNQSRIFTEMMIRADFQDFSRNPGFFEAVTNERRAAEAWRGIEQLWARQKPSDSDYTERSRALSEESARAQTRYLEARRKLDARFPRFADLFSPRPVEVSEAQGMLANGEVVLAYVLLPEVALICVVTADEFRLVEVPVTRQVLENLVRHVHRAAQVTRGLRGLRALNPKQLQLLYAYLLSPVEDSIKTAERVIVMADGPLYTLPFEIMVRAYTPEDAENFGRLRRENQEVLYSEYAILDFADYRFRYVPSFAALRALRAAEPRQSYQRTLIAFADPVFGRDGASEAGMSPQSAAYLRVMTRSIRGPGDEDGEIRLERLENTASEAQNIAEILGGDSGIYLRDEAREGKVREIDFSGTEYLLFATHGLLGGDFVPGAEPSLALSLVGIPKDEDGFLTMAEVAGLELDARLVALSACKTAGEIQAARNGEGFAGLTRAFMHAGARNLLVTHWSIETTATQRIMEDTFRGLHQGLAPSEALRRSQSGFRDQIVDLSGAKASGAHPFFWAPFVIVGGGVGRQKSL